MDNQLPLHKGSAIYHKYKDSIKKRASNYYHANKDHCLEVNRNYYHANKEKIAEQQRARRAKKRIASIEVQAIS